MPPAHPQMAEDVDDAEDAELRRIERQGTGGHVDMDSPSRHSTRSSNVFTSEDGSPDRSGGGERQQPPPQSTFPRPPVHAAARAAQIQQQAANILTLMKSRAGITTYKTSWKAYDDWHECRWACKAPRCPWTGLLWLDVNAATEFASYMAADGRTAAQVCVLTETLLPALLATWLGASLPRYPATPLPRYLADPPLPPRYLAILLPPLLPATFKQS